MRNGMCLKILDHDSMKQNRLRHRLEISHPQYKKKPVDIFSIKCISCHAQQSHYTKCVHLYLQTLNLSLYSVKSHTLQLRN